MTMHTTRRALLGAGAATLAAAAPAVALGATSATPSVPPELQAIVARVREAGAQADAAADALSAALEAMDATGGAERPAALYVKDDDALLPIPAPCTPRGWRPDDPLAYTEREVETMRFYLYQSSVMMVVRGHCVGSGYLDLAVQEHRARVRATEIVTARDAWLDAMRALDEAFAIPRLEAAERGAISLHRAALASLAAMSVQTLPAAAIKARVLADFIGDGFDAWASEEVDDPSEALARSIVRDLARLDVLGIIVQPDQFQTAYK